jgi:hypothetical protein
MRQRKEELARSTRTMRTRRRSWKRWGRSVGVTNPLRTEETRRPKYGTNKLWGGGLAAPALSHSRSQAEEIRRIGSSKKIWSQVKTIVIWGSSQKQNSKTRFWLTLNRTEIFGAVRRLNRMNGVKLGDVDTGSSLGAHTSRQVDFNPSCKHAFTPSFPTRIADLGRNSGSKNTTRTKTHPRV